MPDSSTPIVHDISQMSLIVRRINSVPYLPSILSKLKLFNRIGSLTALIAGLSTLFLSIFLALVGLTIYNLLYITWTENTFIEFPFRVGLFYIPSIILIWFGTHLLRASLGLFQVNKISKQLYGISGNNYCSHFFSSKRTNLKSFPTNKKSRLFLFLLVPSTLASYIFAIIATVIIFSLVGRDPNGLDYDRYHYGSNTMHSEIITTLEIISASIWAFIFALFPWAIAISLHRLVLRLLSIPSKNLINQDTRDPVLLLRSFSEDNLKRVYSFGTIISLTQRFEEIIAMSAWRFGPVTCIGRPGERLPKLGSSREYVKDENWKKIVSRKIKNSGVIAVLAGNSDGLQWELNQIKAQNATEKVLLLIPPTKKKHLQKKTINALRFYNNSVRLNERLPEIFQKTLLIHQDSKHKLHIFISKNKFTWDYETAFFVHLIHKQYM